ncbi:hypothetical protein [Pseudoalteromonas fuliginea]|uniref:ASCH domain-containing protein n=1 Tax=Pseudoalteromonas fuliginea TaxID=1872678 RepID=A0ABD3YA91_9GAMM|nr:hypothetical protein [Pseudoalteromonas fuliginea]KDC51623.1 hypothetical protein DC53_08630 [Pseudoalteromonas fuliginea]KJZ29711.1 hypothetical protein TW82_00210 [Pseudoalteromonas fuliginea]
MFYQSKTIILSIKPVFVQEIYNKNKLVELRKKIGKKFISGNKIIIYSTSPVKAITGQALIAKIERVSVDNIIGQHLENACIDEKACRAYFNGSDFGFLIWLEDVFEFENALPLLELKSINFFAPQSFAYASDTLIKKVNEKCLL